MDYHLIKSHRMCPGKRVLISLLSLLALLSALSSVPDGALLPSAGADNAPEELTVLFTHDIHDYLYPTETVEAGQTVEHGGAARLASIVQSFGIETAVGSGSGAETGSGGSAAADNVLYLDGGDFSMGTLYQAAYSTDAYELRNLGLTGCAVTTFGNHEFDYGAEGTAAMLRAAAASGDPLPLIVQSNIDFSGELTAAQQDLKEAFEEYGVRDYVILEKAGYRIGIFGLVGLDCIECIQTELNYTNYTEAAKKTVAALEKEGCDIIIALSHSGISSVDAGEDIELAKAVPGIDLIISGHTHSTVTEPVMIGSTALVCCGEYLKNVGKITFSMVNGKISISDYALIPVNSSVPEDAATLERMQTYKEHINSTYLAEEGVSFDDVICHSSFDLISLNEMYATHQEYSTGNLIADSYLYEAERCGIDDIDVALVGLGTIRGSVTEGNITVADAFEICSLGVGGDGSAGHPLAAAYITGKELRLLTELDASLGELVSSIKMSYSGLTYSFNAERVILDRVTDIRLLRNDGTTEEIDDDRLYKVCANMYSINMLGMLNGLTKGLLSITPKYADGTPVTDFYDVTLKTPDGREIKEWVALKNYLSAFNPNEDGISELPPYYSAALGRKEKTEDNSLSALLAPGKGAGIFSAVNAVVIFLAALIVLTVILVRRKKKSKETAKQ